MKHLMTLVALLVSTAAVAQIPTLPWNPDENGDQLINVSDLFGLLGVYGQQFPDSLVVYGVSELEAPDFCSLHPTNCQGDAIYRILPQDADVVFWDYPIQEVPTEYDMESVILILPADPKFIVIYGCRILGTSIQNKAYYKNVDGENVSVPMQTYSGVTGGLLQDGVVRNNYYSILTGWNGMWYANK